MRRVTVVFTCLLILSGMLSYAAPSAQAAFCSSHKGTIKYHDFGGDIYAIWAKGSFCSDGRNFTSFSWSRGWAKWDVAWSWCNWTQSNTSSGYVIDRYGRRVYWKKWYIKGCFHDNLPPFINAYPDLTIQIYADGNWNCSGHPYDGASIKGCT
jgi:hypothetical protein